MKNKINHVGMYYVFGVLILQAFTNILFKSAALNLNSYTLYDIITNELYLLSLVIFFGRAFFWMIALKHIPLGLAYSVRSFGYIILLIVSYYYFSETITSMNVVGCLFIVSGIIISVKK